MFGKEAEEQLMSAVRDVHARLSDETCHPNDAVVKTALAQRLPADMLPLLVQAINVGRQTYQRQAHHGQPLLRKLAEFPLASIEEVRSRLYPDDVRKSPVLKTAAAEVSTEYSRPPQPRAPQRVKAAAIAAPPPREVVVEAKTKVARLQTAKLRVEREVDDAKVAEITARDRYLGAMGAVANYFKQADYCRRPLSEVEYNACCFFGPVALDIVNYVVANNRTKEARAVSPPRQAKPVSPTEVPYSLFKRAIDLAEEYLVCRQHREKTETEAPSKIAALMRPFAEHFPLPAMTVLGRPERDLSGQRKAANLFTPFLAGAGAGIAGLAKPKGTPELVDDVALKLDDPEHLDELKSIEARAMLNDLLANDDVVSGFDPQEVSEAYNEIVQLSPSAATQPAVMRPLLRKRLTAGAVEPFEAQQIADVEKTMRQTEAIGRQGGRANASPVLA